MSLRELTEDAHKAVEETPFAKRLVAGLAPAEYYNYVYNQYLIYSALEAHVKHHFPEFKELLREDKILSDLRELERTHRLGHDNKRVCAVVSEYDRHLRNLDSDGIFAHMYVRYLGDMYGGQYIKRKNPGPGSMYVFNNASELKEKIRSKIKTTMADEAIKCFDFAARLYNELNNS